MISGSVVVPSQKGPCGERVEMRGFLLPLLEAAVVVLVLFFYMYSFIFIFEFPPTSPIADSNMKQQQERPSNVETGAGTIFIILIVVMLSSGVCIIYCGFKMCTIHRRIVHLTLTI